MEVVEKWHFTKVKKLHCKHIYVDVEYDDIVVVSLNNKDGNSTIIGNFYRSSSSFSD